MSRLASLAARGRRAVVTAVKAVTLLMVCLHFTLTAIYVLPPTPIKIPLLGLLDRTVGVYARQNWSLFAPNPISSNQAMLAKCLTAAEADAEQRAIEEGRATTGWAELSTPVWTAFQRNRFSSYDRLIRPYTHNLRHFLSGGQVLSQWEHACRVKHDKEACATYETAIAEVRTGAAPALRKLGSAFCQDYRPGGQVAAVALRARLTPALRWSQRHDAAASRASHDVDLGLFPIDRSVARPGLFRAAP